MHVVDWPGREGLPVVLDQPLRLEFDRELASNLRAGAVVLQRADGSRTERLAMEVNGRFLTLRPRLPLVADLSDGSLQPGARYRLLVRGAPHLAAVSGKGPSILVGDRALPFETVARDDPDALAGSGRTDAFLRLQLPDPELGLTPQATVPEDGLLELPLNLPVDPRTLVEPALLLRLPFTEEQPLTVRLRRNDRRGAALLLDVGRWEGWAVLELPRGLEGIGGIPLLESHRKLRLQASP